VTFSFLTSPCKVNYIWSSQFFIHRVPLLHMPNPVFSCLFFPSSETQCIFSSVPQYLVTYIFEVELLRYIIYLWWGISPLRICIWYSMRLIPRALKIMPPTLMLHHLGSQGPGGNCYVCKLLFSILWPSAVFYYSQSLETFVIQKEWKDSFLLHIFLCFWNILP
jgi:hypothetical protein